MTDAPVASAVVARFTGRLPDDWPWLTAASALAALGVKGQDRLADVVRDAVAHHHDPARMRETLLQTLLFAGYPCALNALTVWRHELESCAPDQLAALATEVLEPTDNDGDSDADAIAARGRANAGLVYGRNLDRLMDNASALSPDLAHWMINEGYGRVLGRPNLPFPLREACIVATLVPLAVHRQLFSHIKGCLNVGVPPEQVRAVVELAGEFCDENDRLDSHRTMLRVLSP